MSLQWPWGRQGWHRMSSFCPGWRLLSPAAPEMGPGLGSQQCFGLFPLQPQPKLPELREHSHWDPRLNKRGWYTHMYPWQGVTTRCATRTCRGCKSCWDVSWSMPRGQFHPGGQQGIPQAHPYAE